MVTILVHLVYVGGTLGLRWWYIVVLERFLGNSYRYFSGHWGYFEYLGVLEKLPLWVAFF